MKILVTGGAGYIGSTVCSALEDAGHQPVVLDSLVTGPLAFTRGRPFYQGEVADERLLARVLGDHPDIAATVHFAARIVVPESVARPELYYRENVVGSLTLFAALEKLGQTRVVFSSSASVYATPAADGPDGFRVTERSPLAPASPYARSKYITELMLEDLCAATPLRGLALRYFNPIGADPQGRSGMHVADPSHVLGRLLQTAQGRLPRFTVTGTDYATRDGSGLRDYIHVWDLAQAHVRAVEQFDAALAGARAQGLGDGHFLTVNVGTGNGVTVRELLSAFEAASGQALPQQDGPPRPGDGAGAYADISRARQLLGWAPQLSTTEAIASALAWERRKHEVLGGGIPGALVTKEQPGGGTLQPQSQSQSA